MNALIEFHTGADLPSDFQMPDGAHFGVLRISTPEVPLRTTPLALYFNLDRSSSMDEVGNAGTKMQHLKHTMKQMLNYLHARPTEVVVRMDVFDHAVHPLTNGWLNLHDHLTQLQADVENLTAWGVTNLEQSLNHARTTLHEYQCAHPDHQVVHIQLTDGEATVGKRHAAHLIPCLFGEPDTDIGVQRIHGPSVREPSPTRVASWDATSGVFSEHCAVPNTLGVLGHPRWSPEENLLTSKDGSARIRGPSVRESEPNTLSVLGHSRWSPEKFEMGIPLRKIKHIFVGFGESHDGHVLSALADHDVEHEYRFVDQIDHASLVYGEILYNLLHPCVEGGVQLHARGCEIYDWRTNVWVTDLPIASIPGNTERTWQVRSTIPQECSVMFKEEEVLSLPGLVDEDGEPVPNDLTCYAFRQRTQELLYAVRQFKYHGDDGYFKGEPKQRGGSSNVPTDDRRESRGTLRCAVTRHSPQVEWSALMNVHFLRLEEYRDALPEDRATERTFLKVLMDDTYVAAERGFIYACSRHTSQGRQYTYSATGVASADADTVVLPWEHLQTSPGYTLSPNTETTYTNRHMTQLMDEMTQDVLVEGTGVLTQEAEVVSSDSQPTILYEDMVY